jgi:hypothetical protein
MKSIVLALILLTSQIGYATDDFRSNGYVEINPTIGYGTFGYQGPTSGSFSTVNTGIDVKYGQNWSSQFKSYVFFDVSNYQYNSNSNTTSRFGFGLVYVDVVKGLDVGIKLGYGESLISYPDDNNNINLSMVQTGSYGVTLNYLIWTSSDFKIRLGGELTEISSGDSFGPAVLNSGLYKSVDLSIQRKISNLTYFIKYENLTQSSNSYQQQENGYLAGVKINFDMPSN